MIRVCAIATAIVVLSGSADGQVLINEFLASNVSINPDMVDFDDYSDWIELHNSSDTPLDLGGYFLTDNLQMPVKWAIPEGTVIKPQGYLLFWADDYDDIPGSVHRRPHWPWNDFSTQGYHTNFKVSSEGETLGLYRAGGRQETVLIRRGSGLFKTEGPENNRLISRGSMWKYLDDGSDQGTEWTHLSFDDSQWASGRAQLGYGDGDEATVVEQGPDDNRHTTTYFRKAFRVDDAEDYQSLTIRLLRDDGAVVYLNGTEVMRSNMPDGPIDYNTLAAASADEDTFYEQTINSRLLVDGENVIAVEIHQVVPDSSDISFDLELTVLNSTWKYRDDGSDQGTDWIQPSFDDSEWAAGPSQLGYGGDGEVTPVNDGPDDNRYITTYFRKAFTVDNPGSHRQMTIGLLRDDGAIVYLNGVEIIRSNMPDGPINYQTPALSAVEEDVFHQWTFDSGILLDGRNVLAVEIHQISAESSDISFDLEMTLEGPTWKYQDDGLDRRRSWIDPSYDDSGWQSGPSQLGYGDSDEATPVGRGIAEDRHITTYFRKSFYVANAADYHKLMLALLRDDGAVVYLNGAEIIRSNMPDGLITYETLASSSVGGIEEDTFRQWTIDAGDLIDGENVLAVEIHQVAPGSSDISFDLGLTAISYTGFELVDAMQFGPQISDVSYGRNPSDGNKWYYYGEPTPGSANNTEATLNTEKAGPVEFSIEGGFCTGNQILTLTGPSPSAVIRYTTDFSTPHSDSLPYNAPLPIDQTTIIRARAFQTGLLPGGITTNTYFFNEADGALPIISLVADPDTLWGETIGIYQNGHKQREIPVSLEYFEADGERGFKVNAGARLAGMNIWRLAQKPFSIYMRNRYGDDAINYHLFDSKVIGHFERITLRNGGDDWDEAMLRDAMTEQLLKGQMSNGVQAYSPSVLFLNGQYWGIHNIRERFDKQYFAANYDLDPGNIDHLEYTYTGPNTISLVTLKGDQSHYLTMMNIVENRDLSDESVYKKVSELMDIDSFIDFAIVELYVCNPSWRHNREWWRPRTSDGQWKWLIPDLDRGFYWSNVDDDILPEFRADYPLFDRLVQNAGFRNRFVQRFAAHLNSTFSSARISAIVDELSGRIAPEMESHSERWRDGGGVLSVDDWHSYLDEIKDFSTARSGYVFQDLDQAFDLNGTVPLTLNVNQPGAGRIIVNDVPMLEDAPTGTYFSGIYLQIAAVPNPGFEFERWQQMPGSSTLDFAPAAAIPELTAIFQSSGETVLPEEIDGETIRTLTESGSPYTAQRDVSILPGVTLTVEEGVEIRMPASASIYVHGSLMINGTPGNRVVMIPDDVAGAKSWGALCFMNPTGPSVISGVLIKGATKGRDPILQKAAISGYHADLTIEDVEMEDVGFPIFAQYGSTVVRRATISTDAICDYINVKYGDALIEDSVFWGNSAPDTDAIDYDGIVDGVITGSQFYHFSGINGDAIDIGENSQDIVIADNLIYDSRDKGVSVGQNSTVSVERNLIAGCNMGVAVKDGAYAYVKNNTFYNNDISVACYEKNLGKGGGSADVVNSILSRSRMQPISVDALSVLNISYSLSDTAILPGVTNLFDDPRFVDPCTLDLELQPDSPCIDNGDPAFPQDPDGSVGDIGAYYAPMCHLTIRLAPAAWTSLSMKLCIGRDYPLSTRTG